MLTSARKTYVVPTHLRTPETVLTFGGLSLSARQFLLLLVGAALSYDLWKHLETLTALPGGIILAGGCAFLPSLVTMTFAFGRIAGRSIDAWFQALLRYLVRPKRLVWHSTRFQDVGTEESEERHG